MQLCTAVVVFMGFYFWTNNRIFYLKNKQNLSKTNSTFEVELALRVFAAVYA